MPDLELTTKQAAAELGVTPRTVCNWCNAGKLVAREEKRSWWARLRGWRQ